MFKKIIDKVFTKKTKTKNEIRQSKYDLLNQVGFVGVIESFWENKYKLICNSGRFEVDEKWMPGKIALMKKGKIIFRKDFERPWNPRISKNGIIILVDWLTPLSKTKNPKTSKFFIISENGEELYKRNFDAYIQNHIISEDGKYAIAETAGKKDENDNNKLFLLKVETNEITVIKKPNFIIENIKLDTQAKIIHLLNDKEISLFVSFKGEIKNMQEFKKKTLEQSSISEKYNFYSKIPNSEKYKDENYLQLLLQLAQNETYSERFNKAKLYRKIGEYHLFNQTTDKALFYWEKALKINPKVGVKKRYDKLIKNHR